MRGGKFQVRCDNGKIIVADLSRSLFSFQKKKQKLVEGTIVLVEITIRDLKRGRIVSFKKNVVIN